MSLPGCAVLLLLLGVITPAYTADPLECNFPNNTANSKDYHLRITPEFLNNNTVYTVKVTGHGKENVQVLLQARSNNTSIGTWSPSGNVNCSGGPLLNFTFDANNSLSANWTSPSSPVPDYVKVEVSITNGTVTYHLSETLYADLENAASSIQPLSMFLAIIETLCLLVITSKLL